MKKEKTIIQFSNTEHKAVITITINEQLELDCIIENLSNKIPLFWFEKSLTKCLSDFLCNPDFFEKTSKKFLLTFENIKYDHPFYMMVAIKEKLLNKENLIIPSFTYN